MAGRIAPERVTVDGAAVGILRAGPASAPPLVLLHGYSGDMLTWQFQIGALARHYRVVAADLPGHGLSDDAGGCYWRELVPWLFRLLTVLGIDRPHLVGHSLGARVALGFAEAAPALPRSLSLVACAGLSPSYDYGFLESLTRIASEADALACTRRLFGGAAIDEDRFARALLRKLGAPAAQESLKRFLAANFAEGRLLPSAPVDWARIACPLQLVWGRDDTVVGVPEGRWLPPAAPLRLLDRVGHMPHVAAPDRVTALLLAHCRTADAAAEKA